MNKHGSVIALPQQKAAAQHIEQTITIGKDVLELLTGAMYVDPLCIYREYVQNACDAIDEAVEIGVLESPSEATVEIVLDQAERSVKITDTGCGVPTAEFVSRLTAIGASKKRGAVRRGFRGVGRLSGLGYCQQLIFRSRAKGDEVVSEITWDGRRLRELLRDQNYRGDLAELIREIAVVSVRPADGYPKHFFEVELRKLIRLKNDVLMNERDIHEYLSQVTPAPFHPEFSFGEEIRHALALRGLGRSYAVSIADIGAVYRPFRNEFSVSEKAQDGFSGVRFYDFEDSDGNPGAFFWVLDHSYLGALPKRALVGGVRMRSGNIQVGPADILAEYFPETRFNSWCVGEVHVTTPKIIPNARRDHFEPGVAFQHLIGNLVPLFGQLGKTCRSASTQRNRAREAYADVAKLREFLTLFDGSALPTFVLDILDTRARSIAQSAVEQAGTLPETDRTRVTDDVEDLLGQLKQVQAKMKRRTYLAGVSAMRRNAYEEVLRAIYDVSEKPELAHQLVLRVLPRLAAAKKTG